MPTANQLYFDAALRHQIGLRRYSTGEVRRIADLLQRADADLILQIRTRMGRLAEGERSTFSLDRLQALLADVKAARQAAMKLLQGETTGSMQQLGQLEVDFEQRMLATSIPIEISFATVSTASLYASIFKQPFQGKLFKDWFSDLTTSDFGKIRNALQLGVVEGESIDQMVRRLAGTRRNNYTDGVLSESRRNIETIVRTSINHTSNAAREEVWKENSNLIQGLRWTSTLDGRTSAICRARDGTIYPVDSGPRPPAHPNCRSVMVAVLDGEGVVGKRPFVVDTRTRGEREIDFRAQARREGVPIQEIRAAWAEENVGRTAAATTYSEFLGRQSAAFQDDVLGKTKGALFRRGGLPLDAFVDRAGNELTIDQLRKTAPWAFEAANLN